MPDFSLENQHSDHRVCGIDEVGRGPLAGPVVAACVYIPNAVWDMDFIAGIRDSKTLSGPRLEALYDEITTHCDYGIAQIEPEEIDRINILQAAMKAMRLSLLSFRTSVSEEKSQNDREISRCARDDIIALIDGNLIPDSLPCPAQAVVKGDGISRSIAAASIVAKVTRDRMMRDLALKHPGYGWESNVGYPSPAHLNAIDRLGITLHHRKTFAPVRRFLETGTTRAAA